MTETTKPAAPIRSITRGLEVLRMISLRGPLNMAEITREVDLPYPTVCRIVNTLVAGGYVEREPARKHFRAAGLVQSLSHGYQYDNQIVKAARRHLVELTRELDWVTVLATRLGSSMVVRDSTHVLTPLTFNHYYPGFTFSILDSAAGRVHLAFSSEEERETCFRGIEVIEGKEAEHAIEVARNTDDLENIRQAGFATRGRNQFTSPPGKLSSIAAPIFHGDEVCGALSLVFFAAAMTMEDAIDRYASRIMLEAKKITDELAATDEDHLLES